MATRLSAASVVGALALLASALVEVEAEKEGFHARPLVEDDYMQACDSHNAACPYASLLQTSARALVEQHRCFEAGQPKPGQEQDLVFCYAIVQSAPSRESTAASLGQQLSKACDGWSFFSTDEDDPGSCTWQAFSEKSMRHAIRFAMREMVGEGVLPWLEKRGILERYRWLVKVDPDSFVRPSALREGLARYPLNFNKILSVANAQESKLSKRASDFEPILPNEDIGGTAPDGYFVALPTSLVPRLREVIATGRKCDSFVSGHQEHGKFSFTITEALCTLWSSQRPASSRFSTSTACELSRPLPDDAQNYLRTVFHSNGTIGQHWLVNGESLDAGRWRHWLVNDDEIGDVSLSGLLKRLVLGDNITLRQDGEVNHYDATSCFHDAHFGGVEMFVDKAGDSLVATGGSGSTCSGVAEELLTHQRENPTSWQEKRLCKPGCSLGGEHRAICVSSAFAVAHAVKDKETYEQMVLSFP